eukprot:7999248-Pyramimonas_sp.AAC.2
MAHRPINPSNIQGHRNNNPVIFDGKNWIHLLRILRKDITYHVRGPLQITHRVQITRIADRTGSCDARASE